MRLFLHCLMKLGQAAGPGCGCGWGWGFIYGGFEGLACVYICRDMAGFPEVYGILPGFVSYETCDSCALNKANGQVETDRHTEHRNVL